MAAKWSLRFGALAVVVLCLGLFGWVGLDLHQSRERELQAAEHAGGTLAKLLEGHLQGAARQIDQHLSDFVLRFQFAVADRTPRAVLEPELQRYLSRFSEVHSFRVADAEGRYLYDASGVLADVNIADRPYFIELRDNPGAELVISPPIVSRVTNTMVIVFARRLQDRAGNFIGIVLGTLRADYFERYYRALDVGPHGVIALWSRDFELFARWPQLPAEQGKTVGDSPIPARLQAGKTAGTFRRAGGLDGEKRVFSYRAVDGFPFVFSVGLAERDVLAEWQRRALTYGVLGVVLLIALIALIRAWGRGYRQAEELAEKMTRAYAEKTREGRALLDSIPDPAWLLDNDGRFLAVNEAYCRSKGLPMDNILGRTVEQIFPAEEAKRLREGQLEVYRKGEPVRQLVWLQLGGQSRPFEFLRVPVYGDQGEVTGLAGVAWDVTERYKAEERQRLITHFFDHANDAVLILDAERRVLTLNPAVTAISGYDLADLKGKPPRSIIGGSVEPDLLDAIFLALAEHGVWRGELDTTRKDGSPLPIYCNISAIRDDDGKIVNWSVFVTDLSERKAAEARIESLTHVDQLTELPNRQGFSRMLGEWLAAGKPGVLIVIDLDQLSRINDAFGHSAGDTMLRRIGARLRRILRNGDVLGRLGGDQFGLLISLAGRSQTAEILARNILDNMARPVTIEGSDVVSTACAGICLLGTDGNEVATLLRNADAALHHAKTSGQNLFRFFSADMNVRMAERLRLESDLRGALGRGELALHYQPQVDLKSGEIVGFESLLRWQHPELGMVSPVEFIPVAEESRLILPIGAWVLEEACRQNKAWQDAGMAPKVVAVNLSAVQFHSLDVVSAVSKVLAVTGLEARFLELEITESVIVEDPERVVRIMDELKALGVGLSIDDFGTGYSSLAYLKRFPIDKIKIDRSFVRDLERNANDAAIIRMVIGIAAELERKVIAEGVETIEQLEFLRRHNCDEYQGYYCSRPVSADAIPALVARHRA
ncbi:EAL domain-containing protein [Azonexus sp. IMCC34842]|uniref:bifunctional diguanylate cyclase/phosphodiesterase n=1 Tax=Azonexus sp. IMCC34842 TaxID=3420950 RepID=UPI003D0A386F